MFGEGNERKELERKMQDEGRLPPGQSATLKWPVLHYGGVPRFEPARWDLKVWGQVENPLHLTWEEFNALPRFDVTRDFHCVTRWSRFDNRWTGVAFRELAIEDLRLAFEGALPETSGLAAENLQARIRGVLLMTLSNQHGLLVLTTGNKSEVAVGYTTLYGDSAGGFAPIKDVPKTLVFALARYVNERAGSELIPVSIIERPPSAELRDGQRDDQSLPPYAELDPLIEAYVEDDLSPEEIARRGLATLEVAQRIARLVDLAEYKRRQAPPGIRVHNKAFGRDRRLPITNRFGR